MSALTRMRRKMAQMNDATSEMVPPSAANVPVNAQVGQVQAIQPGPVQNLTDLSTSAPTPMASSTGVVDSSVNNLGGGGDGEYTQEGVESDLSKVGADTSAGGYRSEGVYRNDGTQPKPTNPMHEKPENGLMRTSKTASILRKLLAKHSQAAATQQASGTAQLAAPKRQAAKPPAQPINQRQVRTASAKEGKKMPTPLTKLSAEQQQKLAEIEQFDREQAFELGFTKAASELGLNEAEFKEFYEAGCEKLAAAQQSKTPKK